MYKKYIKRVFDFIIALLMIIVSSPIMLIIAIAIKLEDKGPVLFCQKRSGLHGKIFNMYKFRSMSVDNDVHNFEKENEITKVGSFLRKTSLDELPNLFSILSGKMSLLGPRPWIEDYNKYFTDDQRRRLEVKPGVSGLAQVKNRNNFSIQEKIKWDIYYVDHLTFWMDVKVFFWTIMAVLSKEGAELPKSGIKNELDELKNQHSNDNTKIELNERGV